MTFQQFSRQGVVTLSLVLLAVTSLCSQGVDDVLDYRDIPVDADNTGAYLGVGFGYLGMLTLVNYDNLNEVARSVGFDITNKDQTFSGPFFLHGGGGFASILLIDNLRLGVYGAAGTKKVQRDLNDSLKHVRSFRFTSSVTAVQIDYAIRLLPNLTLLPGIMGGLNVYTLRTSQSRKEEDVSILIPDSRPGSFDSQISSNNILYYPALNIEWAPSPFVMLRGGAGYSGIIAGDWTDGNDVKVSNLPDISAKGVTFQFGLFLGLFQQRY